MKVGSLEIELLANMARLQADIQKATTTVRGGLGAIDNAVSATKRGLAGLGIGLSGAMFVSWIKGAIDAADAMNKLTQRTGLAAETLSQMQYAAKLADVSHEGLNTAIKKLNISVAQGLAGDKEKVALFKQLGITTADLGRGTESVMLKMADAYARSRDGAGKVAVGNGLMGKTADEMIPFLNAGGDAIRAMMKEADALGLTISTEFAAKAEEFNDNLSRITSIGQKLGLMFASDFVDGLSKAMKAMSDAVVQGKVLAGVVAGLQTLLTGDDRYKNDKAFVEQTEKKLALEKSLARMEGQRTSGRAANESVIERQREALALVNRELQTTTAYRKILQEEDTKTEKVAAAVAATRERATGLTLADANATEKASKAASLAKAELSLYTSSLQSLEQTLGKANEQTQFQRTQYQLLHGSLKTLGAEHGAHLLRVAREIDLQAQLEERTKAFAEHAQFLADEQERRDATLSDFNRTNSVYLKGLEFELSLVGMTTVAREQAIALRKLEDDYQKASIDLNEEERKTLKALYEEQKKRVPGAIASKASAEESLKSQVDMWGKIESTAEQTFSSIFDSGKNAFDRLKDTLKNGLYSLLYQMTVKRWIVGISASVSGQGVAEQAFGAQGGGLMGMANNASSLSSLYSAGSQFLTGGAAGASGASLAYANMVGALGGDAIGALATANGGWAGVSSGAALTEAYGAAVAVEAGTAAGAAGATGAAAGISSALAAVPVWGWAALAGVALLSMSGDGGGPKTESGGGYGMGRGDVGGPTFDYARGLESSYGDLAQRLGLSSRLSVGAFSSSDPSGDSLTQLDVAARMNNQTVYSRSGRLGGDIENVGRSDADLQAALAEEATRVMVSALKASDLEPDYKDFLNSISENATAAALESAVNRILAVKGFKDAIEKLPFENLKNLSFAAADGLIALSGGLESLGAKLDAYYQNFYSAEEQRIQTVKNLFASLGAAGVDVGTISRPNMSAFRALVDQQDVQTESGRRAYAALISVSAAFADLARTGTAASEALNRSLTASIGGLKALAEALRSAAEGLGIGPSRAAARIQIASALAAARSGGALPTVAMLAPALKSLSAPSEGMFRTFVDWRRDQQYVANDLNGLATIAETQASVEQKMLDALMGIDAKLLTVAEALSAREAETLMLKSVAEKAAADAKEKAAADAAKAEARRVAEAEAAAAAAAAEAIRRAQMSALPVSYVPIDQGGYGDGGSFAVGTNWVPYDMRANIHEGERIVPKADNVALMEYLAAPEAGSVAVVAELRENRAALGAVHDELVDIRRNVARTAAIVEKSDAIGPAPARAEL